MLTSAARSAAIIGLLAVFAQAVPTPQEDGAPCDGTVYTVQAGDDCTKIGQAKGVSAEDIVTKNNLPNDCRSIQPGQQLCIPTSTAPACTGSQYTVQAGDDCTKIGQAKGVPATDIVKANNLPDDCKSLQPGQQLCIPASSAPTCTGTQYTVKEGDDCTKIAQAQTVPVDVLIKLNGIDADCKTLQIGQQLCLPPSSAPACNGGTKYTVVAGDDCTKIAMSKFTTAAAIIAANGITNDCKSLQIGQQLCIPANKQPACDKTYIVKAGDSCISIALAQGVTALGLEKANQIPEECKNLQIGQSLCIPKDCKVYKVKAGDTCQSVGAAGKITSDEVLKFNPNINKDCTNLLADTNVCISSPLFPALQLILGEIIGGGPFKNVTGYNATGTSPPFEGKDLEDGCP